MTRDECTFTCIVHHTMSCQDRYIPIVPYQAMIEADILLRSLSLVRQREQMLSVLIKHIDQIIGGHIDPPIAHIERFQMILIGKQCLRTGFQRNVTIL